MPNDSNNTKLIRFSITVPEDLLAEFEGSYYAEHRPNRSESVRNLMREYISSERWRCSDGEICATITIVYDHHLPELTHKLTAAQHDSGNVIICATHVHLNHHTCLECVITKGNSQDIQKLIEALRKIRGIKSLNINVTSEI
ncbi:MAG: nickel-responsive transcriptional regulator NikR [Synergistaceae bacterium]|nr:nickel-responsive transcriptional regulator NikR [Synergistaceae bacterium]